MSTNYDELLQQLAGICCPTLTLSPVSDADPLVLKARTRKKQRFFLFTRMLTLWTIRRTDFAFGFHVTELNFDSLAQCHSTALAEGTAQPGHSSKYNRFRVTALVLCDCAQPEAFESVCRFKGYSPVEHARLDYRLIVVDRATGEVVCNHRARKFKSKVRRLLSGC